MKMPTPLMLMLPNQPETAVYSLDQLKQAVRDALEEAAQVAESEYDNWDNERPLRVVATAIRAMKEQIK